jgi:hypothetical protein
MIRVTIPSLAAALAGMLSPAPGAAQSLPPALEAAPPEIRRETAEAFGLCLQAGGQPSVGEAYLKTGDLNGDGSPDYVLDLNGLACEGAPPLFCGPDGCPVMVWLSGPDGLGRVWGDLAPAARMEADALVVAITDAECEGDAPCERRVTFQGVAPGATAPEVAAAGRAEGPRPRPRAPVGEAPPPASGPAGTWTLRAVPEGDPVAVSDGPGAVAQVAVFCLGGSPWLALTLEPRPSGDAVTVGFAFDAETLEVEALWEDGAGGAYVVELANRPLAGLLAGRDRVVDLTVSGRAEGALSLFGSTRAIRRALEPCGGV